MGNESSSPYNATHTGTTPTNSAHPTQKPEESSDVPMTGDKSSIHSDIFENFILGACGGGSGGVLTMGNMASHTPPPPDDLTTRIVIEGGPCRSPCAEPNDELVDLKPSDEQRTKSILPNDSVESDMEVIDTQNEEAVAALSAAWETSSVQGSVMGKKEPILVTNPQGTSTSLHRLAFQGVWAEMRECLTEVSSKPGIESGTLDEYGRTPLMVACTHGSELPSDVARLLLVASKKSASIPIEVGGGETFCLHVAAASGCTHEVMQILIKAHAEAAASADKNGNYPLHLAINTNRLSAKELVDVTTLLIKTHPQALVQRNLRGETPLILAIYRRAPTEVLNLLISGTEGQDAARIPDAFGSYPLHFCDRAPSSVVRQLVKTYPEAVGVGNKLGDTPLFFALHTKAGIDVLEILLREGHEPGKAVKLKNAKGFNVIRAGWDMLNETRIVAAEDQDDEDRRVTQNRVCIKNASSPGELFGEVKTWWKKTEMLLRAAYHGTIADPLPNSKQWRVVHAASGTECPVDLIRFILQIYPKEAKETDEHGNTPLHIGSSLPDIVPAESISLFYNAHPPSAIIQNKDRSTPLHIACLYRAPLDVLDVLLNANPDSALLQNKEGQTPLYIAIAVNSPVSVLRLLLRKRPNAVHIRDVQDVSPLFLSWLLLVSGKVVGKRDEKEEQSRGKANRLSIAVARSSGSLVGGVREWMGKIDLLLRAAFHAHVDQPLPKNRQWRAVHAASMGSSCPPEILRFALQILPNEAHVKNEGGNLPLHIVAAAPPYFTHTSPELGPSESIHLLLRLNPVAAKKSDRKGRLPLHLAISGRKTWYSGVQCLVEVFPEAVRMRDPVTKLFPFMLAASVAAKKDEKEVEVEVIVRTSSVMEEVKSDLEISSKKSDASECQQQLVPDVVQEKDEVKESEKPVVEAGSDKMNGTTEESDDSLTPKTESEQVVGSDAQQETGETDEKKDESCESSPDESQTLAEPPIQDIKPMNSSDTGLADLEEEETVESPGINGAKKKENKLPPQDNANGSDEKHTSGNENSIERDISEKGVDDATQPDVNNESAEGEENGEKQSTEQIEKSEDPIPSASGLENSNTAETSDQEPKDEKSATIPANVNIKNKPNANKLPPDHTKVKMTPELASLNTIYELLLLAPELMYKSNGDAETLYLWRSRKELIEENDQLKKKLSVKEAELRSRMTVKELKDAEDKKKKEEIRKREEECSVRADVLERTSGNYRSWMFQLESTVAKLKGPGF